MGARPLPWALVTGGLLIAALLTGVIYLPAWILHDAGRRAQEHHGTVTVDYCQYRGRANDTADCFGTFRSDDGALNVRGVQFSFIGAHQDMIRREPAPATLAGPEDTTAEVDELVGTERAVLWVVDAFLFAWLIAQVVWFVRALRLHRAERAAPQ